MGRVDEEWTEVRRRGRKKHRQADVGTGLARQRSRSRRNYSPLSSRFVSPVSRYRFKTFSYHSVPGSRNRSVPCDHRAIDGIKNTLRYNPAVTHATRAGFLDVDRPTWPRPREGRQLSSGHQRRREAAMIVQRRAVVEKQANPSYGCRRDDQNVARSENISSDHKRYVSFYFTNFPVQLSHFYLRKGFEVCGILEDVYVARKRNKRGQPYGFVRFSNVRDIPKLTKALNAVSFGDFRVWARVARFDRNVVPLDETVGADVDKVKGVSCRSVLSPKSKLPMKLTGSYGWMSSRKRTLSPIRRGSPCPGRE
jgi:hypothetical protein